METSLPLPCTVVLFDVDGTLVDSGAVVMRAFEHVIDHMGLEPVSREHLTRYVGPPLWESFGDLGLVGADVDRAVDEYRRVYRTMFLEPPMYEGVRELLDRVHAAGVAMSTATSKQEYMARDQLEHLGVAELFTVIAGATPDPACTKATVVRDALARLGAQGVDVSAPLLVGDRHWDVEGGREAGVPVVGAGWGYGSAEEFAGAVAVADSPAALAALLGV